MKNLLCYSKEAEENEKVFDVDLVYTLLKYGHIQKHKVADSSQLFFDQITFSQWVDQLEFSACFGYFANITKA